MSMHCGEIKANKCAMNGIGEDWQSIHGGREGGLAPSVLFDHMIGN